MPHFPDANRVTLYTIDGHKGYWEKITRKESKEDGHKQHAVQALYGEGSLGYFVPVVVNQPIAPEVQPTPVTKPPTAEPVSSRSASPAAADALNS